MILSRRAPLLQNPRERSSGRAGTISIANNSTCDALLSIESLQERVAFSDMRKVELFAITFAASGG